ncbi:MAG TPA: hypothetical protein VF189_01680 [Patescibacteria group bacterium]
MEKAIIGILVIILFFSIRGIISLILIIWGGKKIKDFWQKRKEAKAKTNENKSKF